MKPEMILQADVLDIIFDERNKEYGAYELRSHYTRRLKKAMLIIFSSLSALALTYYWLSQITHTKIGRIIINPIDSVRLTTIDLTNPLQPQIHNAQHRQVATIPNTVPLIVRNTIITKPVPTLDQLDINKIGADDRPGELAGDIIQPTPDGNNKGNSVEAPPAEEKEIVFKTAEFMPQFPGGEAALQRFLLRNLRMPKDLEPGSKIMSLARFVVDKDGRVTGIEFEKSGGKDFDEEVTRVIKKMPQWKPGMQNGRNVSVYFTLPVIFQVPDEN